jgi:hypothetical protein
LIISKAKSLAEAIYYIELSHENSLSRNNIAEFYKSRQLPSQSFIKGTTTKSETRLTE